MKAVIFILALASLSLVTAQAQDRRGDWDRDQIRHVLLISIDGMHAVDYLNCREGVAGVNDGRPYCPNLAALGQNGVNYVAASASKPSDSFPGLTAIVTGGSPRSTGVYYDVAYDRSLDPPQTTTGNGVAGGKCEPNMPPTGTTTEYEEGIDIDQSKLNGGAPGAGLTEGGVQSIDPTKLPRDPARGCAPVYPWEFVRVNSIYSVIHEAGGYTAWSDKHPAYSSVAGRAGVGSVNDYYSPEINSDVIGLPGIKTPLGMSCETVPDPTNTGAWTDSFQNIQCYDTLKVNAILNEISGFNHNGTKRTRVPNIYGMNFQAVSVGQKLIETSISVTGGYTNAQGTPTAALLNEIKFVDASIGEMVDRLKASGKYDSTLIVITAKHGQSPIDPHRFLPSPGPNKNNGTSPARLLADLLPFSESPNNPDGIGPTEDDISLLWLADAGQALNAVGILEANAVAAHVGEIFYGHSLSLNYNRPGLPPSGDPRTPDIIVQPQTGTVYTGSSKKLAEHGGFAHDDVNVMLLLSNPSFKKKTVSSAVETSQVAPTILKALGLDPRALEAVRIEGTPVLPDSQLWEDQH